MQSRQPRIDIEPLCYIIPDLRGKCCIVIAWQPVYNKVMILAETLGCAIPTHDFDASVHSVFTHACNLQITGGGLITLLDSKLGKLPQGIMLSLPDAFSFESIGFRRGQYVACRNGIIHINPLPFQIDLTTATHWRADLLSYPIDMRRPAVRRAWLAAHAEWQRVPTPADAIAAKAQSVIRSTLPLLARAVRAHDLESSRQYAARLIGLGIGLTPSGDDVLVGFLAGLWSTFGRQSFLDHFAQEVISLAPRTTDISRAYLIHAAQGQVSSVLENLCHAIARGAPADEIRHATLIALHVGHTSGADGVGGLLSILRPTSKPIRVFTTGGHEISASSVFSVD